MKRLSKMIILAMMVFAMLIMPAGHLAKPVYAASAATKMYRKRAKIVKKYLPKKVVKLIKKRYSNPSCRVISSQRKGKTLTCELQGSIGEGAYMETVKINLKNGKVTVIQDMVDLPKTFKVKYK